MESGLPNYDVFQQILTEHLFYVNSCMPVLGAADGGSGVRKKRRKRKKTIISVLKELASN